MNDAVDGMLGSHLLRRAKGVGHKVAKNAWAYTFVAPMFLLFVGFTVYPLLSSVRYTLYDWNGIGVPKDYVGLRQYAAIASNPFFWNAFKNTFVYAGVLVPTQLSLALAMAVILNSRGLKLRELFRSVFLSPIVTSSAIVGVVISLLVSSVGSDVGQILMRMGLAARPIDWLGDPRTAMWMVIGVGIWIGLGYPIIYFLAGLQAIDAELFEAAKVDGAGPLALFWHITLPSMQSIAIVVLLLTTLHSLRVFDLVQSMTRGGPYFATDVVGTFIYRYAFFSTGTGETESSLGLASAAAFFMGILVLLISMLQVLVARRVLRNGVRTDRR